MANFITIERLRQRSDEEDLPIFSAMAEKGGQTQKNKGGGSDDGDESAGEGERRGELKVVAQLQSLSVSLNAERGGERLALLAMEELGFNWRLPAGGGGPAATCAGSGCPGAGPAPAGR